MDQENQWHLDKKVPVAFIIAIVIQTGTAIWWLSAVNARVEALEAKALKNEAALTEIIQLRARVDNIYDRNVRMEDKIDRLSEKK